MSAACPLIAVTHVRTALHTLDAYAEALTDFDDPPPPPPQAASSTSGATIRAATSLCPFMSVLLFPRKGGRLAGGAVRRGRRGGVDLEPDAGLVAAFHAPPVGQSLQEVQTPPRRAHSVGRLGQVESRPRIAHVDPDVRVVEPQGQTDPLLRRQTAVPDAVRDELADKQADVVDHLRRRD